MDKKSVLGRGLDSIIPSKVSAGQQEYVYLELSNIEPNKFQPREQFTQEEMEELMHSLKTKGLLQPIIVRKKENNFEIIAGGRRYEAARRLGWVKMPAIIKDNVTDQDSFLFAIIENLQRQNLNPLEEAFSYKRLMDEFAYHLQDVAEALGKDKSSISNMMRLLKLPHEIKEGLRTGIINKGQARTILSLENEHDQIDLYRKIINEALTVRHIEEEVRRRKGRKSSRLTADVQGNPFIREIENVLQQKLGTKVSLMDKKGKGKIIISYYSEEDLERIALLIKSILT